MFVLFLANTPFYFGLFISLLIYFKFEEIPDPLKKSFLITLIYYFYERISYFISLNLNVTLIYEILNPVILISLILLVNKKRINYDKLFYIFLTTIFIINTAANITYYFYAKVILEGITSNVGNSLLDFFELLTPSYSIFPVIMNILKYLIIFLILLYPSLNEKRRTKYERPFK